MVFRYFNYPFYFSDVLAEIDAKNRVDIREEEAEATALRILGMLRILKYKPPLEISVADFRQGLVEGQKNVIYPVMEWLLQRIEDLKTRAYLAKYLVKIEIPTEVAANSDVAELYDQYEEHIAQFKVLFVDYFSWVLHIQKSSQAVYITLEFWLKLKMYPLRYMDIMNKLLLFL